MEGALVGRIALLVDLATPSTGLLDLGAAEGVGLGSTTSFGAPGTAGDTAESDNPGLPEGCQRRFSTKGLNERDTDVPGHRQPGRRRCYPSEEIQLGWRGP